jgi:hypothetical protein
MSQTADALRRAKRDPSLVLLEFTRNPPTQNRTINPATLTAANSPQAEAQVMPDGTMRASAVSIELSSAPPGFNPSTKRLKQ